VTYADAAPLMASLRDPRITTARVAANGLEFEVDQCGDGNRLALCLHGFPEHSFSWRHQLPLLAEQGYRAWAPNLRGYGGSSRPPHPADYAIEHLLEDVAGLIDAGRAELGDAQAPVVLLAHDWGAVIAWYFAMRRLRDLDRLVIMNVPHPAAAARAMRQPAQLRRSWYVFFFQIPWLPEKLFGLRGAQGIADMFRNTCCHPEQFSEPVCEVYRRNAAQPGALKAMIDYYRALVRGGGAARQRDLGFPLIETPTLMLWGEEDVALTLATTEGTGEFVRDLTFRRLPRVSHWVQQDAPEAVNAMLEAWLNDRPVPQLRWRPELVLDATPA